MTSTSSSSQRIHVDWDNELTLQFFDMFGAESVLWNKKHPLRSDRSAIKAAWIRLSKAIGISVPELKRKKRSLMQTFGHYNRKKRASIMANTQGNNTITNNTDKEVYKPTWFAYQAVEDLVNNSTTPPANLNSAVTVNHFPGCPAYSHKSRDEEESSNQRSNVLVQSSDRVEDECDVFGKLTSTKLQKIPIELRDEVMFKVDEVFIMYRKKLFTISSSQNSGPPPLVPLNL